jgi:AraC family transcriptional regulator of adaptative response/methylated-DNA-[protein]-cysteine methyltransferase
VQALRRLENAPRIEPVEDTAMTNIATTIATAARRSGADNRLRAERVARDPRWPCVVGRDRAADETFYYSVRTTGVYCRPSCAARTPRPENVDFYATREAAERAGFRACRRCRPDQPLRESAKASNRRATTQIAPIRFTIGACSLGSIAVAASERGICSIAIADDEPALLLELLGDFPNASLRRDDAALATVLQDVVAFVDVPTHGLRLPLDIAGSAFQRRVWRALVAIPAGATASYRDIAERIGAPVAVRAVARACAANRLAVAIPCHRVVRSDGALSGYRWGVERKRRLLACEAAA